MTYLVTLERELRGCKIVVGGYCSSQRLYSIQISIKIQISKEERNLPKNRFVYSSVAVNCKEPLEKERKRKNSRSGNKEGKKTMLLFRGRNRHCNF